VASGPKLPRLVCAIWLCFLARGLFYCSFLPLWEGYDEWAHFAVIDRMVTSGRLLIDRKERASCEVEQSLELAPVPWELRTMPPPSLTQDAYWQLASRERSERQQRLRQAAREATREPCPSAPPIYEALQAPLYYWLLSIPYQVASGAPLTDRVFLLRYVSLGIASLAVPLAYLLVLRVGESVAAALGAAALMSAVPELMVDVCRVGNECLGIVIYTRLTLLCFDLTTTSVRRQTGFRIGVALGLGLLTKAYFLAALPALAAVYLWRIWRGPERRALVYHAAATASVAMAIAAWWYVRNYLTTATWSGLYEAVELRHSSWPRFFAGVRQVNWPRAFDSILMSHIWFGGWSSLVLRSWMYHAVESFAAVGSAGILRTLVTQKPVRRSSLFPLLAVYVFFWIGELYNVLLLFMSKGVSTSMGWYLYAVGGAEVTLLLSGLAAIVPARVRQRVLPLLVLCFVALDFYSVHFVSIPYYAGLTAHRYYTGLTAAGSAGSVSAFHISQLASMGISGVLERLAENKPGWLGPGALAGAWAAYCAASLLLLGLAARRGRPPKSS
jgi:Dolichyl-phosphate-mannose-protein mannosyltransferase